MLTANKLAATHISPVQLLSDLYFLERYFTSIVWVCMDLIITFPAVKNHLFNPLGPRTYWIVSAKLKLIQYKI